MADGDDRKEFKKVTFGHLLSGIWCCDHTHTSTRRGGRKKRNIKFPFISLVLKRTYNSSHHTQNHLLFFGDPIQQAVHFLRVDNGCFLFLLFFSYLESSFRQRNVDCRLKPSFLIFNVVSTDLSIGIKKIRIYERWTQKRRR